jgi:uncharacterized phage protein gp47/JayE
MSDSQGALCFLTLEYVDWLSLQLLPDTAETEWLDRQGNIWLVNADGTIGRKQSTLATGSVIATGVDGSIIPAGSLLGAGSQNASYQVTVQSVVSGPVEVPLTALDPGTVGNMQPDDTLGFLIPPPGVDGTVTVVTMDGGADVETDAELRARILRRIQQPPMGGDATDYEAWALAIPGVTRAWAAPNEMGIGTVTTRFLMDDLRADDDGWPTPNDIQTVAMYIDEKRPVTVKDCFVLAPIKYPIDIHITFLNPETNEVKAEIEQSIRNMLRLQAAPGATIFAAWVSYAIMNAPHVVSFRLSDGDFTMPSPGHMAVLNSIIYPILKTGQP